MKKIIWEVQSLSLLPALKYCKKCGRKNLFTCSRQFRINSQRRYLDIWLIYKCSDCNSTWKAAVYSRISPQALKLELLDGFYKNDNELVEKYAMDSQFLQANGVEVSLPKYSVIGDCFSLNEAVQLEIKNKYSLSVKVSSIVRNKLLLSEKEYLQLITSGKMKSIPNQNLKKCKLKKGVTLVFDNELQMS
nr:DUF1062 domain-containing protein [uncultured Schaedlerella sp.]